MSEDVQELEGWRLEDLSPTVLYDIFYEWGTILGGRLVSIENCASKNRDSVLVAKCRQERIAIRRERDAVGAFDRDAQIACILKWQARWEELGNLYPERNDWLETQKR